MKTIKSILIIIILLILGCDAYKVKRDLNDEPILGEKMFYKFSEKPNANDLKIIDTTSFYVQIFEGRYYNDEEKANPFFYKFHSDGYFKQSSIKYDDNFRYRTKNSLYYGGKYRIIGNTIELEYFVPSRGSRTNIFGRAIEKGRLENGKIYFDNKENNSLFSVYEKKSSLN